MSRIKFRSTKEESRYFEEVKAAVSGYFTSNHISQHANGEMLFKVVFWILFWIGSWWAVIVLKDDFWLAVCAGIALLVSHLQLAFNIIHDANHYAVFKNKKANDVLAYLIEFIGCNRKMWHVSHNLEHHTFINIHEHDTNIEGYKLLRLTPEDKWYPHHKYQWLYAPFVYGLSTLNYAALKDLKMIFRYSRLGKIKMDLRFILEFIFFKILYYGYMFVIPIAVFHVDYKIILTAYLIGHFIVGNILAIIFVIGHITEGTSYPDVSTTGTVENNWAVHVVKTTGDFSTRPNILQWFVGGVNIHVSHHLFPDICHVHYRKIAPIIKKITEKYNFTYREIPHFWPALASHFRLLKELGIPAEKPILAA